MRYVYLGVWSRPTRPKGCFTEKIFKVGTSQTRPGPVPGASRTRPGGNSEF